MNTINNFVNITGERLSYALEVASYALTHNEPLERCSKIVGKTIEMADLALGGLSLGWLNFGDQIRDNVTVLGSLRFFGVLNLVTAVDPENGKSFFVNPKNSWQKRVDRVNLLFHTGFKTYKGMNKFGFVSLGAMAKNAIGKLPIFTLVMDSFMLASCTFSTWDSIGVSYPKVSKSLAEADRKISKWESRPLEIAFLKANIEEECTHFAPRYQEKAIKLNERLENFEKDARLNEDVLLKATEQNTLEDQAKVIAKCSEKKKELANKIERVYVKQLQNDERLTKIATGDLKGLAEDLEGKNVDLKLKTWELKKANAQVEQSKVWLRIANSICKFAVIVLALTLVAANVWTAPATLSLLVLGIVADSIGLVKNLTDVFWKGKPIPKNFAPAAA